MFSTDDIDAARAHLRRKLLFPPGVEERFRETQRSRYRLPRAFYFGIVALAFALAPLYNAALFAPDPSVHPLVLGIQLLWALPALLASMAVNLIQVSARAAQAVQTYGVLSLWGSVLCLYLLDLLGQLHYPPGVLAAAVVSVACFGGFRTRRVTLGVSLFMATYIALTLLLEPDRTTALHRLYESVFFWTIAVASAVTHDQFSRHLWLQHQASRALARIDHLTGIPNRATFQRWFTRIVSNAARQRRPVAVALIDLDHFKSINDRFGHAVGDEVLRRAADAIADGTVQRPLDIHARFGGEEFAMAWYDMKEEAFEPTLERIHGRLRRIAHRCEKTGQVHHLTASIGAVHTVPHPGTEIGALLLEADRRLYQAKDAGRDRTVVGRLA